jgi:hypothetical protein
MEILINSQTNFLKYSIILFKLILIPIFCLGQQTNANITTPKGSSVNGATKNRAEHPAHHLAYLNQYYDLTYPNAIKLDSATNGYNCHGYAWHMSSGGAEAVWIQEGNPSTSTGLPDNEDIYWTDGSYIEVCTPHRLSKVSYHISDHSAITTANVFISKWGDGPLMQHAYNYAPYNSSLVKQLFKAKPILS